MHNADRNLANRLFVTAAERIEDAVEIAVAGQSTRLTPTRISDHGRRPQAAAHDLPVIAEATTVVADLGVDRLPNQRDRPR